MNDEDKRSPSLLDVTRSVLWGALGVQKSENYKRDFTHGKAWQYIVVGIIAIMVFIGTMITIVNIVISNAAA